MLLSFLEWVFESTELFLRNVRDISEGWRKLLSFYKNKRLVQEKSFQKKQINFENTFVSGFINFPKHTIADSLIKFYIFFRSGTNFISNLWNFSLDQFQKVHLPTKLNIVEAINLYENCLLKRLKHGSFCYQFEWT